MSEDLDFLAPLALAAIRELAIEIKHRLKWCDGYRLVYWVRPGVWRDFKPITCRICLEEIIKIKADRLFAQWDALGLGYIGPRLERNGRSPSAS